MIGCGMAHGQDLQAAAAMLPVARSDGREVEGAFALPPQLWLSAEACSAAVAACERRGWDVTSTDPVDGAPAVQRTLARRPLLGAGGVVERSGRAPRPLEVVQDDDGAWALAREALELARPRVAAYYSVPAESIELLWAYVKIYDATSGRRGLGEHSDASDVTLNVMLSCEDEGCDGFGGGTRLYLFDAAESATLAVRRAAFRAAHGRGGDWGAELARSLGEGALASRAVDAPGGGLRRPGRLLAHPGALSHGVTPLASGAGQRHSLLLFLALRGGLLDGQRFWPAQCARRAAPPGRPSVITAPMAWGAEWYQSKYNKVRQPPPP